MTNNQLTVPETSDDQIALVQQILDDPRELAPSVQVRFAKRIGRPGSSRVMLMDAQTSGPIAEEDEESVSNLALRLADGTNVQLSLSFFNDNQPALAGAGVGGGGRRPTFAPFNTYVYEPRSYTIHKSESKLPLIMMTTAIVLAASCYGFITGPFSNYLQTKTAKPATAASTPKAASTKNATVHAAPKIVHEPIPAAPPINLEVPNQFKSSSKKMSSATRTSRTHSQSQSSRTEHTSRNEMFVPPPPPMSFASAPRANGFVPPPPPTPYTLPAGIPTAYDPLQSLAPAVARSGRVYTQPKKSESIMPNINASTNAESRISAAQSAPKLEGSYEKPVSVQQLGGSNGASGQQLLEQTPTSAPDPTK